MQNILQAFYLGIGIIVVISLFKIFEKTREKGWKAIIPLYNLFIIQKIINKPWWWMILMFIPWFGIIWTIWSTNLLAKSFGKNRWFTLGMILLPFIFYPVLALGDNQYAEPIYKDGDINHKIIPGII